MKSVRTTLAYFAAAIVLAFGLLSLLNPLVAVRVLGLEVIEPRGLSEIRASYGAFVLAMGGAMVWAIPMRPRSAPWLRFAGLAWAAATVGRVASVVLDGAWTPLNLVLVVATGLIGTAFLLAGFQTPAGGGRTAGERWRGRRSLRASNPSASGGDEDAEREDDPLRAYRS